MSDQRSAVTDGSEARDEPTISVLCVDDERDVVDLTGAFLERESDRITTRTVTNVRDALERLDAEPIDCVVSDYQMPGTDGLAFLDVVRDDYDDLPFVLFTGQGSEEIASEAISRGVTDYLQKEPGTDQYAVLANRIENVVVRHRAESRFESFLNSAPYGIVISDAEGHIHQVNEHLNEQFGYERDQLLGEPIEVLLPERYRDEHARHRGRYVASPERRPMGADFDLWGRRTDGSEFPVEITLSPIDLDSDLEVVASVHDVTVQREREEQFELAETLFENAQDALFIIDVDEAADEFRLERVSPAYEAHAGLSNDEIQGRSLRDVFGDEEGEAILRRYRECVDRREPLEYEERLSVPEAGTYWETRIAPVVIDGCVEQLVGATRNVTERKKREQKYDAIFNQTYQFTGLMEPDGTMVEANESALEFGGLAREDVVGKPVWETGWFTDDEATKDVVSDLVDRASSGEFVRAELDICGADRDVTVDYSIKPITDETGEVGLLLPEARDITALKEREEELEQKREFLAQIQEVADIGGWEYDSRTDTMRWTEEVYRIHGMPLDYEPTVEEGIDFYHPGDRATIRDAFERLTTAGEPYDLKLRIITNDDEMRWVRSRGEPWYDDDGDLVGVRGAFRDITERTERERELERQNDRLEEFAAVVSHDLRNPLTVAQGSLELGRQSGAPEDFERVENAHERMNTLINDLLTLARQGQLVEETQSVVLDTIVAAAWETVRNGPATLDVALDGYRLDADESRLRQLFENLLSNAVRHGGDDVSIRVGLLDDGDGFYVEDDGPGIPAAERESVFEHGYSTTRKGTGFGLAIVEEIAEAHGWTVAATESADGGARFEIAVEPANAAVTAE
ncbi:PAS domain S-box protein [Halorientalis brevis]|uniref:histidine kinase n=1 Tax=Halorientalis brevis TaxID=1126241 RepID=A0ABD6CBG2_9EURY|nr:PAS domain S-box protein [Halorientalis brevis]